jgi:4-hydroxy-tetrahydrodipicolinate reductase
MEEIHHTQIRRTSGTAISLAKESLKIVKYNSWTLEDAADDQIHIEAKRIGTVPGTHTVNYDSLTVLKLNIQLTTARFALGAVIAAEWIIGKQGVFTMKDVLEYNNTLLKIIPTI